MLRLPAVVPEARLLEQTEAEAEAEEADGSTAGRGLRRCCRMRSSVLVTAARTMYSLKAICVVACRLGGGWVGGMMIDQSMGPAARLGDA